MVIIKMDEKPMTPEKFVRLVAGIVVLAGTALAQWVSPWWHLLTAFAGLNLIQSVFTGFCPPEIIFRKFILGKEKGKCCQQ
ncbi:MAG: YgaP family membrane protein [Verrucomicrobiia bacterium]